jgi:hypothetical protein
LLAQLGNLRVNANGGGFVLVRPACVTDDLDGRFDLARRAA